MIKLFNKIFKITLKDDSKNFFVQFIRYFITGGAAFIVDYSLLLILKEIFGFHYLVANTISFISALFVNYFICKIWTFKLYKGNNKYFEFFVFFITSFIGLLINDFSLWFIKEKIYIDYRIAKVFATIIAFVWNFLSKKFILFNDKEVSVEEN
ncbi:MAG: GtrA family protein [Spirochaetes bacterium]|nr:GtrA family protein [Spirochaetota bacterium]